MKTNEERIKWLEGENFMFKVVITLWLALQIIVHFTSCSGGLYGPNPPHPVMHKEDVSWEQPTYF